MGRLHQAERNPNTEDSVNKAFIVFSKHDGTDHHIWLDTSLHTMDNQLEVTSSVTECYILSWFNTDDESLIGAIVEAKAAKYSQQENHFGDGASTLVSTKPLEHWNIFQPG